MDFDGKTRFTHFHLENRLYTYINHVRQRPQVFKSILEEKKKYFGEESDALIYKPPCLAYHRNEFFVTKEGFECVVEAKKHLEEVSKHIIEKGQRPPKLVYSEKLGKVCKFVNPVEVEKYVHESDQLVYISLPFRAHHLTSQQLLLDLLIDDGNKSRSNRLNLFVRGASHIGIGFHPYKNRDQFLENGFDGTPITLQIVIYSKVPDQASHKKLRLSHLFSLPTSLQIPKHVKTTCVPNPDVELNDVLYLDDNFEFNETISLNIISRGIDFREGMRLYDLEGKQLDYKCFETCLNSVSYPRMAIGPQTISNFIKKITEQVLKYFVAFSNTLGGMLVIGVTDKTQMVSGEVIDGEFMEKINKKIDGMMKDKIRPQVDSRLINLKPVSVKSNFKDMKILILEVKKAPMDVLYVLKQRIKVDTKSYTSYYCSYQRQQESVISLDFESILEKYIGIKVKKFRSLISPIRENIEGEEEEEEGEKEPGSEETGKSRRNVMFLQTPKPGEFNLIPEELFWKHAKRIRQNGEKKNDEDEEEGNCQNGVDDVEIETFSIHPDLKGECKMCQMKVDSEGEYGIKLSNTGVSHKCDPMYCFTNSILLVDKKYGRFTFAHKTRSRKTPYHICDRKKALERRTCSYCNQRLGSFSMGKTSVVFGVVRVVVVED